MQKHEHKDQTEDRKKKTINYNYGFVLVSPKK